MAEGLRAAGCAVPSAAVRVFVAAAAVGLRDRAGWSERAIAV